MRGRGDGRAFADATGTPFPGPRRSAFSTERTPRPDAAGESRLPCGPTHTIAGPSCSEEASSTLLATMPPPQASSAPPSASRLSHLSTTTLSSVLELTRLNQLGVAPPAHLSQSIQKNLVVLLRGIVALESAGSESDEVLHGLRGQWERIAGLVEPLGVAIEERLPPAPGQERTGRLVETDDEHDDEGGEPATGGGTEEGCVSWSAANWPGTASG